MVKAFKYSQWSMYSKKLMSPLLPLTQRIRVAPALLAGAPKKGKENWNYTVKARQTQIGVQ